MRTSLLSLLVFLALAEPRAAAQCLDWSSTFGVPGVGGQHVNELEVRAFAFHDDGSGPALYLGGYFDFAGGAFAEHCARWNGSSFEALGASPDYPVGDLEVFDDGSGPKLYAGMRVWPGPVLARWDGSTWTTLAGSSLPGAAAYDLAVFDDGGGAALYAAQGAVLRWTGSGWSTIGTTLGNGGARKLHVHDDGNGPALFAAGSFTSIDGVPAVALARWNGSSWSGTGGFNPSANVLSLCTWNTGGSNVLAVGGTFVSAGGLPARNVATWNGVQWSALGSGTDGAVNALAPMDPAGGGALVATGSFDLAGGVPVSRIARFDGTSWSALGSGLEEPPLEWNAPWGYALLAVDDGAGPALFAGGHFARAGGVVASSIARFANEAWSGLGPAAGILGGDLLAALAHDDGSGRKLYVAGDYVGAGDVPASLVSRWNGARWEAVGTQNDGAGEVRALCEVELGGARRLVAAGRFNAIDGAPASSIASWDGVHWNALQNTTFDFEFFYHGIDAVTAFDDGGGEVLVVAGEFTAVGGVPASRIARFDGTSWSTYGPGLSGRVRALAVFDDGAGARLYAGGDFGSSGGIVTPLVARWNGATWESLPGGVAGGNVQAFAEYDDGVVRALYLGGRFTSVAGVATLGMARWSSAGFEAVGSGVSGGSAPSVYTLRVFDEGLGRGTRLFAGGYFTSMDGRPALNVAAFDGSTWTSAAPGGGVDGIVRALEVFDDGQGASLFAVGHFDATNFAVASRLARYGRFGASGCEPTTGTRFCAGDGSASACPCGNTGAFGAGCDNSSSTGGAELVARGQAHLNDDTVTLRVERLPMMTMVVLIQGTSRVNSGSGTAFGDGLRCAGGPVVRLGIRVSSNGTLSFGEEVTGDPALSTAGAVTGPARRNYQAWYRDAQGFCTSSFFNLSNGVELRWAP